MPQNFRNNYQDSEFIQDATETSTLPVTNEYFTEAHVEQIASEIMGIKYALGAPGLRGVAGPVWGDNTALQGTAVSSLTTVVFSSTQTALTIGALICGASPTSTGFRRVTGYNNGLTATVDSAFTVALNSETAYIHGTIAERLNALGSGSGVGGINYVVNWNAEQNNINNISASTANFVATTTAAAGELLRDSYSFKLVANGSQSVGDYIDFSCTSFDPIDANKVHSIQFNWKGVSAYDTGDCDVVIYDVTNATEIIPSQTEIPSNEGTFIGTWVASDSTEYKVRFKAQVTTAFSFSVDNIVCGPNEVFIAPGYEDWKEFTMTIGAVTTAPTKATTTVVDKAYWRRVGDSMEIVYSYRHSSNTGSAAGSGAYLLTLPTGYTIDSTKISISSTDYTSGVCGNIFFSSSPTSNGGYYGMLKAYSTTQVFAMAVEQAATTQPWGSTHIPLNSAAIGVSARFVVPIAEWTGNATYQNSRVEYVYNSDTTNADDTTSFANGETGSLVPVVATTTKKKRVQFSREWKHVTIQIKHDGTGSWLDLGTTEYVPGQFYPGETRVYGMYIRAVSSTQYDVYFAREGIFDIVTETASTWTSENSAGVRWRVVGSDNPLAVANPTDTNVIYFWDLKSSGTDGGGSSAGTQTRTLNTTSDPNNAGFASVSSNDITVTPGVYEIEARAPARYSNGHQILLTDTSNTILTDASGNTAYGSSVQNEAGGGVANTTHSFYSGTFNFPSGKTFRLRHYISYAYGAGLGAATSSGNGEKYAEVKIRKIA